MRCRDGSIRRVLINSSVLWRDGQFVHTRCFTRDVTDRKRAEEARSQSEAQLAVELAATQRLVDVDVALRKPLDYDELLRASRRPIRVLALRKEASARSRATAGARA